MDRCFESRSSHHGYEHLTRRKYDDSRNPFVRPLQFRLTIFVTQISSSVDAKAQASFLRRLAMKVESCPYLTRTLLLSPVGILSPSRTASLPCHEKIAPVLDFTSASLHFSLFAFPIHVNKKIVSVSPTHIKSQIPNATCKS